MGSVSMEDLKGLDSRESVHAATTILDNYPEHHSHDVAKDEKTLKLGVLCTLPWFTGIVRQAREIADILSKHQGLTGVTAGILLGLDSEVGQAECEHIVTHLASLRHSLKRAASTGEASSETFHTVRKMLMAYHARVLNVVGRAILADLQNVEKLMKTALENAKVKTCLEKAQEPWADAVTKELLECSLSDPARQVYRYNKYMQAVAPMFVNFKKSSEAELLQATVDGFAGLDLTSEVNNAASALLTAIQTLARPLKVGESRSSKLEKVKKIFEVKGMWACLPGHVKDKILQGASEAA
jgi:hypothetical protein